MGCFFEIIKFTIKIIISENTENSKYKDNSETIINLLFLNFIFLCNLI